MENKIESLNILLKFDNLQISESDNEFINNKTSNNLINIRSETLFDGKSFNFYCEKNALAEIILDGIKNKYGEGIIKK